MMPPAQSNSDSAAYRTNLLKKLTGGIPYIGFLNIHVDQHGEELTTVMPFQNDLIGNPYGPFIHGGVTAAFLETAAIVELSWSRIWNSTRNSLSISEDLSRLPRTITFSVDYLRPGHGQTSFARAMINRSGRRFASVHVEAWQNERTRLFAQATGHFLMPGA